MNPAKIDTVRQMNPPRTVKQVQQFLGLCGYNRKFVKDFAQIAAPLYNLLKKNVEWSWSENCQRAFEDMKTRLVEYPVLRHPQFDKRFYLYTDASNNVWEEFWVKSTKMEKSMFALTLLDFLKQKNVIMESPRKNA
jgi:hypothetical protein